MTYELCDHCKRENMYVEIDHKIPPKLGGDNHSSNKHYLCLECHHRKTKLESSLILSHQNSETIKEWFSLAFNNDPDEIREFIHKLRSTASHMREVLDLKILNRPRPQPLPEAGTTEARKIGCICVKEGGLWGAKLHAFSCPVYEMQIKLQMREDPSERRAKVDSDLAAAKKHLEDPKRC